jgi:LysM repeat protein
MKNERGYTFKIGELTLPYAPSELKVTIGSNNKTVELINGTEINILKNPKLTEFEFDIELPRGRQYPFANRYVSTEIFTDYFERLMVKKQKVKLVIIRPNPFYGKSKDSFINVPKFEGTDKLVTLEGYTMTESAENAYDVKVSLKFKEVPEYGSMVKRVINEQPAVVEETPKPKTEEPKTHTVVSGDCLWNIAKKYYGNSTHWGKIYDANKTVIENTAKKYGRKSSSNGHWIYPGTKLTIPAL